MGIKNKRPRPRALPSQLCAGEHRFLSMGRITTATTAAAAAAGKIPFSFFFLFQLKGKIRVI